MSYRYDDQHQLSEVTNHETGEQYRYAYDLFGRRIEKENLKSGDLTKFLWQGDHLLAEYQDDQLLLPDAEVKANEYRTYLYEAGSFAPLALLEGKGKQATPYFYLNDHLGTPQQLVNQAGQTVWSALYFAYGAIETELINRIKQPLRFQGQYHDRESGLHYNRHRYYNPKTARFITFDPIGLAGGLNNTQYVPNPTGWIDPLGLQNLVKNEIPEYELPQGVSPEQFEEISRLAQQKSKELGLGDDIVIQGSRASHTARINSDLDIAIKVPSYEFHDFLFNKSKIANPFPKLNSSKERTLFNALDTGIIKGSRAHLQQTRQKMRDILGLDVDFSVIKKGGSFDNGKQIPILKFKSE